MSARIAIVLDGHSWFVRRVSLTHQDDTRGLMIYECNLHLGGPLKSAQEAIDSIIDCSHYSKLTPAQMQQQAGRIKRAGTTEKPEVIEMLRGQCGMHGTIKQRSGIGRNRLCRLERGHEGYCVAGGHD